MPAGLRDKIKGLGRFREELPDAPSAEFDRLKADAQIRAATQRIAGFYVAGALTWAREHRPALVGRAQACVDRFEAAYRDGREEEFRTGVQEYGRAMREIVFAFEADQQAAAVPQTALFPEEDAARQRTAQHLGAL